MEKYFIPYEIALRLKELGFDEPCFNRFYTKPQTKMFGFDEKGRHYPIKNTSKKLYTIGEHFVLNDSNVILAPTYSQAFRWFREKYQYMGIVLPFGDNLFDYRIYSSDKGEHLIGSTEYNTYEETEIACLTKLIQIVKEQK